MTKLEALLKYLHNKKGQWLYTCLPYWVYVNHSPEPLEFKIVEVYYDPKRPLPPDDDVAQGLLNIVVRLKLDNPFEGKRTHIDYGDLVGEIEGYLTHVTENYFGIQYSNNNLTHIHSCIIKDGNGRILHETEDWCLTPELLQQR
jgi:hypothetical protein